MVVGERPGKTEAELGLPFVGASGREQDRYMAAAGIRKYSYYKTNLVKDYKEGDPDPLPWEISRDVSKLSAEIEEVNPGIIGAVGAFSARFFLGPRCSMDVVHGKAQWARSKATGYQGWVVPLYHPAGGMHNHDLQPFIEYDYRQLGRYLRGELPLKRIRDKHPSPKYIDINKMSVPVAVKLLRRKLKGSVAVDTEGTPYNPWGLSFCSESGVAYVIRLHGPNGARLIKAFDDALNRNRPRIIYHNALYDIRMLKVLGVLCVERMQFTDSQVLSYQLQVEPQGLKPLAMRHCGMKMKSYRDMIAKPSASLAFKYIMEIADYDWGPTPPRTEFKGGKMVAKKPWPLNRKLDRLLSDLAEDKIKKADLRERWKKWDHADKAPAIEKFGDMPEPTLDDIPLEDAIYYSARDAHATYEVLPILEEEIRRNKLGKSIQNDLGAITFINRMQEYGLYPDLEALKTLSDELMSKMLGIHGEIKDKLGTDLNLNSSKQLTEFLYDGLGNIPMPPTKTDSGQPSLNEPNIQTLINMLELDTEESESWEVAHWLLSKTLEYRGLLKLKSTYADKIPEYVKNGTLHPNFRITSVITGRLSAFDPNVLALPARTELGKRIKKAFIVRAGHIMFGADYSGIEMRVLAHISGDPFLCETFRNGEDQHSKTAAMIWDIPVDAVDKGSQRFPAKTIGFLTVYGGGAKKLYLSLNKVGLNWPLTKCEEFLQEYLKLVSGVKVYMEESKEYCRRHGYVRTQLGRKRILPGIHSENAYTRFEAERAAINFRIQGTAQEIIKRAMNLVMEEVAASTLLVFPLLQIHDDLTVETPDSPDEKHNTKTMMEDLMINAVPLSVPVEVDSGFGYNLADIKE
jgi:uracil-DNA glycosylase family 4